MYVDLPKYPRTLHLAGSKGVSDGVPLASIVGKNLTVEEKVDGSMVAVLFDRDANLRVFHRATEVDGIEFALLKKQLATIATELFERLEDRYIMYGEWLYLCHTIYYDGLPDFFLEYDVFDRQQNRFLSTKKRTELLWNLPIVSVRVLDSGVFHDSKDLLDLLRSSNYRTLFRDDSAVYKSFEEAGITRGEVNQSIDLSYRMEGLYVKEEDDEFVLNRYKLINKEFIDILLRSKHWSKRPLVKNTSLRKI